MSSRRIQIFDTTLRDGEQSPGIALRPEEKAEIAEQLERLRSVNCPLGFCNASRIAAFSPGSGIATSCAKAAMLARCRIRPNSGMRVLKFALVNEDGSKV